jgi:hypothetical protein
MWMRKRRNSRLPTREKLVTSARQDAREFSKKILKSISGAPPVIPVMAVVVATAKIARWLFFFLGFCFHPLSFFSHVKLYFNEYLRNCKNHVASQ